jgi:hypothetical protein
MQRLEVSGAVRHIYIYDIRRLRVHKTATQFGTLIAVQNCGLLSNLLSEVFNTTSNQIIHHNQTAQSSLCVIPLYET